MKTVAGIEFSDEHIEGCRRMAHTLGINLLHEREKLEAAMKIMERNGWTMLSMRGTLSEIDHILRSLDSLMKSLDDSWPCFFEPAPVPESPSNVPEATPEETP